MKVARGRSWQPEIGMEHASRGRRSGNKGVGARWRGRFRIFSARHCSRTKVSHAENSGMTMLFFSWGLLRCRACVDHRSGHAVPCHHGSGWHEGGWFLFFSLEVAPVSEGDSFTRSGEDGTRGLVFRATCRLRKDGTRGLVPGYVPSQERRHEEVLFWRILSHAQERQHKGLGGWGDCFTPTPVVKPSPPQTPSVQTATPPPSSFWNLRRQAGMPPHWRECEAPLRRTQRNGRGCFGAAMRGGGRGGEAKEADFFRQFCLKTDFRRYNCVCLGE